MSQEAPTIDTAQIAQQAPGLADQGGASEREQARGAASAAIRELLAGAEQAEGEEGAAPVGEPEAKPEKAKGKPKQEPKAKAEPEAEAEPEKPAERPLKASELQELKRRQRSIERRQRETEALAQRVAKDREAIEQSRARDQEFERELRRDPVGAVAKRLGVSPDRIVAGFADGKAQQLDPLVQAEIERLRGEVAAEKKAREDREQQIREHEERAELQRRIDNDVSWFSDVVPMKAGDQYPYFSELPSEERQSRAREAVMLAIRYEPDMEKGEILDALELRARQIHDSFTRSERLQRLRGGTATASRDNGAGKPHGKPASTGARPSAREAAEPAARSGPMSFEDRRQAAAASIRELQQSRDDGG